MRTVKQLASDKIKEARRSLRRQLDRHRVDGYMTAYTLPNGYKLDIAFPEYRVGVVIREGDNLSEYPYPEWGVINVSSNVAKNGDARQRLVSMIESRKLQK